MKENKENLLINGEKVKVKTLSEEEEKAYLKTCKVKYNKEHFSLKGIVIHIVNIPINTTYKEIKEKLKEYTSDCAYIEHKLSSSEAYVRLKTENSAQMVNLKYLL